MTTGFAAAEGTAASWIFFPLSQVLWVSLEFSYCFLSTAASNWHSFLAPSFPGTWGPIAARTSCQLLARSAFRWYSALTPCYPFLPHIPISTLQATGSLSLWLWDPNLTWTPISGHCHPRSAVSTHAQALLVATTATDSEFPDTCEQLQLRSVRLYALCVLCPAVLHRDGLPHASLSSWSVLT